MGAKALISCGVSGQASARWLAPSSKSSHFKSALNNFLRSDYFVITMNSMSVKLKIVQIGNSQGVRLPKLLLAQCGIKKEVEVEAVDGAIVLRPIKKLRAGWDLSFAEMAKQGDDTLLIPALENSFDESDWQW